MKQRSWGEVYFLRPAVNVRLKQNSYLVRCVFGLQNAERYQFKTTGNPMMVEKHLDQSETETETKCDWERFKRSLCTGCGIWENGKEVMSIQAIVGASYIA